MTQHTVLSKQSNVIVNVEFYQESDDESDGGHAPAAPGDSVLLSCRKVFKTI